MMNATILIAAIYGTLVGGEFVKAPYAVKTDAGTTEAASLTEPQANALGYKLLVDTPPVCASNEYAVARGYEVCEGRICRVYVKQMMPVAIPQYSVADLTFWAANNGKVDALVAWLKANGYYEVYLTTQSFAADNEVFGVIKDAVVAAGIVTREELSAALAYALIGGGAE